MLSDLVLKKCLHHLYVFEIRLGGNAGGGPGSGSASPDDFGLFTDDVDDEEPKRGGKGGGAEFFSSSSEMEFMASVMSTLTGKNEHVRLFCKVCGDLGGSGGATTGELSGVYVGTIFSEWCLLKILSGGGTLFSERGRCLRGGTRGGGASVLCSNGSSWSSAGGVHIELSDKFILKNLVNKFILHF